MDKNSELMKRAYDEIEKKKKLVESDYYRLKYHIAPPTGLLNDPNGFIYINGEYHLFYQFHPFDTKHGLKYWAHVKSKDLIYWEQLPIALAPSEWYETHGCYSGSAVSNNGEFTLIYTGNVKDKDGNRESYQCIATTQDGINFDKNTNNPVIRNIPEGYTAHFRDPKVWKENDAWYMVIGAQALNKEGHVLLFKSTDLIDWSLIGKVAGSNLNGLGDFGYMWECPDYFKLEDKEVLIACPQGLKAQGYLYNNIYQSGYFVGKLDFSTGIFKHNDFFELDRGFEFYAPQTTVDSKGRRLLVAWMGLPEEEEHPTKEFGWVHALTMPRVLNVVDNKIFQNPVEEMKLLRKDEVSHNNIVFENNEIELEDISGDVFELFIEFENIDAEIFGLKLRCSEDGEEYTKLFFNPQNNELQFNRDKSGKGYGGKRSCILNTGNKLIMNIFSDTSSLEIFINYGEEVFTSRIYPHKDSKGIKIFSQGGSVEVKKITKWNL